MPSLQGHLPESAQKAILESPFASVSTRVFMRNHSYGNVFPLKVHFHANQTHFNMKGFARGHFETEAQGTQKRPIIPPQR